MRRASEFCLLPIISGLHIQGHCGVALRCLELFWITELPGSTAGAIWVEYVISEGVVLSLLVLFAKEQRGDGNCVVLV